jgi:segregation and condensation protein B
MKSNLAEMRVVVGERDAMERTEELRILEALLFAADEPLDEKVLAARMPLGCDVRALLLELQSEYANRGVNIVRVGGKWSLRTASDLAWLLTRETVVTRKLSRAAIETLAIVAYHQPVTRAEIEEIRGVVVSSGTLDVLMEAGWTQPKGRRETPGRPVTWATTEHFLVHFGLGDRNDLPGIEELKAAGLIGPRPDFTLSEASALPPAAEEAEDEDADDADEREDEPGEAEPVAEEGDERTTPER